LQPRAPFGILAANRAVQDGLESVKHRTGQGSKPGESSMDRAAAGVLEKHV
jgi:hypothetical protein